MNYILSYDQFRVFLQIKNIYIFRLQYYFFFFLRGIITKGSQFFFSFSAVFFQMGLKGIYIYIFFFIIGHIR